MNVLVLEDPRSRFQWTVYYILWSLSFSVGRRLGKHPPWVPDPNGVSGPDDAGIGTEDAQTGQHAGELLPRGMGMGKVATRSVVWEHSTQIQFLRLWNGEVGVRRSGRTHLWNASWRYGQDIHRNLLVSERLLEIRDLCEINIRRFGSPWDFITTSLITSLLDSCKQSKMTNGVCKTSVLSFLSMNLYFIKISEPTTSNFKMSMFVSLCLLVPDFLVGAFQQKSALLQWRLSYLRPWNRRNSTKFLHSQPKVIWILEGPGSLLVRTKRSSSLKYLVCTKKSGERLILGFSVCFYFWVFSVFLWFNNPPTFLLPRTVVLEGRTEGF